MKYIILVICFLSSLTVQAGNGPGMKLGLLKYNGGGDWYANPTALKNLSQFCNEKMGTQLDPDYGTVEVGSVELFNYPFVHMTGHGNVVFSDQEADNLRMYLMGGGFLHIDDNYGMDPYVRLAIKKIFPDKEFVEVPFVHSVYHQQFDFPGGLPKIHVHDGKPPKGYGIFIEGRLVLFYSYETDLSDGWEDPEVHKDPEEKRQQALRMGANLVRYAFGK